MNDIFLWAGFIFLSAAIINFGMKYYKLLNDIEFLQETINSLYSKMKKIEEDIYEAYKRLPPLNK